MKWYRWTVIIVGRESGNRTPPMGFVRFRHEHQAIAWCQQMNADVNRTDGLAYFEAVPISNGAAL